MKKILIFIIIAMTFGFGFAAEQVGIISKYSGKISMFEGDSPRPIDVKENGTPIYLKNKISTKTGSSAIIELLNGDRIALDEKSTMTILDKEEFRPWDGKIVFHIKKRGGVSGVKIKLTSTVIGVKGTKFLINAEKDTKTYDIFLKEGLIECTPIEGKFKMYKEVVIDEYEAYVKKMVGELEEYVKKLEEEFVEYVDSFLMKPKQAFTVTGKEVRKAEYTDDIDDAFNIFDELEKETSAPPSDMPKEKTEIVTENNQNLNKLSSEDNTDDFVEEFKDDFDKELESEFDNDDY
ncbi:MAG: hypothetical protein C0602_02805 [Denitrovibrio sp.]|nr:MAG: hypothetical protein C0602_02805 [Denitrovibrio sp.]